MHDMAKVEKLMEVLGKEEMPERDDAYKTKGAVATAFNYALPAFAVFVAVSGGGPQGSCLCNIPAPINWAGHPARVL